MPPKREDPIVIPAPIPASDPSKSAAIIFIHGLGDEAAGLEGIARQYTDNKKLPYMQWVIPNATENFDAQQMAWYYPTSLTPTPSQRPELDDLEDEDGLLFSRKYIVGLIDDLVGQDVPAERIVLAGFSQGHALTLITGLTSKYCGKLAGLACVCGYLPLADRIAGLREEEGLEKDIGKTPMFIMRGTGDRLVPSRYWRMQLDKLEELGVDDSVIEKHEYQGLGHTMSPTSLKDLCVWLERVVPPLE